MCVLFDFAHAPPVHVPSHANAAAAIDAGRWFAAACRLARMPRRVERERKGGGTARRGRGRVDGREECRLHEQGPGTAVQDVPAHKAAAAGGERREGGGRPPDASPRDSRRTGRRPSRAEVTRTVAGHVAVTNKIIVD